MAGAGSGFYPILILTQKEYIEILVAVFEHFLTCVNLNQAWKSLRRKWTG